MSFQSAVVKLESPIKDLVLAATQDESQHLLGKTETDQNEVVEWIEKVRLGHIVGEARLKDLDLQLIPRTYLVNNYLTAADVALYAALHPQFSKYQPPQYYALPSLTRYFDHIQSCSSVRKSADVLSPAFPFVPFNLEDAPKLERKAEVSKKKEKAVGNAASAGKAPVTDAPNVTSAAAGRAPEGVDNSSSKKDKKDKKEKKKDGTIAAESGKKASGGGKASVVEEPGDPVPSMIDLRVGHIVDIMKHPDADGLYVEQIDIGEAEGPRTVVSGLVHYIPIEQMRDRYVVTVCNLKPANMRGVKSFAMVLCATSKDGKEHGIELIQPPENSKPGERVYFDGAEFENASPLAQLNPKKKIFETIQPGFITLDTKEAAWVNPATKRVHKIRTKEGVCRSPTLVGASLS